jgi:two-component system, NtrC family, nitrogen regulation sensor histidine kinase NtrY
MSLLKLSIKQLFILLATLLVLLVVAGVYEHKFVQSANPLSPEVYDNIQEEVNQIEFEAVKILGNELTDTSSWAKNWNDIKDVSISSGFAIYIYRNDTLMQWTSNSMSQLPNINVLKQGSLFISARNGKYIGYMQRKGSYSVLLIKPIYHAYSYKNEFITNAFDSRFAFIGDASFKPKPTSDYFAIKSIAASELFYIKVTKVNSQLPLYFKWFFLLLLVMFVAVMHLVMRRYFTTHKLIATILFTAFWAIVRNVNLMFHTPDFIYQTNLFNPFIYASSALFPSLGDLLVDSLLVLWWFSLIENSYHYNKSQKFLGNHTRSFLLWLCMTLLLSHLSILSLRSITLDSQISFDVTNIFNISIYTYIAIFVLIIQMLVVYFSARRLYYLFQLPGTNKQLSKLVLFVLLGYLMVTIFSLWITVYQSMLTVALFIVFLVYRHFSTGLNRFQHYFGLVFIISAFSAVGIQHWSEIKEKEERKLFAVKLTSQNDITTDYFLRNIETRLSTDAFIKDYFLSPFISKESLEKRIRQIYFTGYLSRYDVNVLDFDNYGNHFKEKNKYSYRTLKKIYETESAPSINKYFRYLSSTTLAKGYIAKIDVEDDNQHVASLFILLKPKLIQNENRFDELLIEGYSNGPDRTTNYSYALYKDKQLVYQSGNFPYRIKNTWGEALDSFSFVNDDTYEHMVHTDEQMLTVIVSKPIERFIQLAGLFSFIFTLLTSVLILILFIYVLLNSQGYHKYPVVSQWIINPIKKVFNTLLLIEPQDAMYLRTRIQTSIIFILFISLLVSAYLTITFITQKYDTRQNERLMKKLRSVVITVENENIINTSRDYEADLEAFVNEIADLYDNDITVFDSDGKVLASSISKIYNEHIISSLMPDDAFYHLKLLKESQFGQTEQIGKLSFQSAYAPFFYGNRDNPGYIQLPYFSQQADLDAEISSVVIGFINLYVVLFIFIGFIAYIITRNISQPLALIQQSLSGTKLQQNEPIKWNSNDEIGELVGQYNNMILQLEESARKLAESEREGAWREIARQIAHEIKNPLTPMKLSIQHLQRAYANNDSNIEEKINRTTQILVKQIDMLSDLASEFSSYAKMPQPIYEWFDVQSELNKLVELYSMDGTCKIELDCHLQSELYYDISYFNRSIGNLIKNAVQAIPDGVEGYVKISVNEDNDNITIVVSDNGSGISPEQAKDIFKPYFSTKINGMGLGLPLVKSMIENGNGTICFESEPNKGTTFTITLPKHEK